ncbi:MAG: prepilin-type N-terminal cleavage/methylation domain-containing protein [Planctomycetota bacterium]
MRASSARTFGTQSRRLGFTLLEVLLATGITSVLVLAVYRATAMHYQQLEAGREVAERAQLLRALSFRITQDVRSAFTRWKPTGENDAAEEEETDDEESMEESSMDSAGEEIVAQYKTPPGGVLGYPNSMTLVVRLPPVDLDFTLTPDAQKAKAPGTDGRMVRYWRATGTAAPGAPNLASPHQLSGLMREELFRLPDPTTGPDPSAWARAEVLAAEVCSLTLRYFDGAQWLEQWDNTNTSAPRAVEVMLGILPPGQTMSQLSSTGQPPTNLTYYRIFVALPDVPPVEEETQPATDAATTTTGET